MELVSVQQVAADTNWLALHFAETDAPRVLVKWQIRDGRAVITRAIVVGDALDSATLRGLPIGRLESWLNRYGTPAAPGPLDPDVLTEMAARHELFPEEFAAIDAALSSYLDNALPSGVRATRRRHKPLTRPDGTDPDGFSIRVAIAYSDAVTSTTAPAKLLALEAGVPVTTVHRWIREARQRGHLPPARKGRAG